MTKSFLALDTETNGLRSFHDNSLFSVVIADAEKEYYFNFNDTNKTDRCNGVEVIPRSDLQLLKPLLEDPTKMFILANAKFDMNMLAREGLFIKGEVWDVLVMARIENNSHLQYSLDACASRIGRQKDDKVKEWIKRNKAYKTVQIPGKKGTVKNPQFQDVPFEIVSEYAKIDARITYDLFIHQHNYFLDWDSKLDPSVPPVWPEVVNEMKLTKVCFEMEQYGIKVDLAHVKKMLEIEVSNAAKAKEDFLKHSGKELVDSYLALAEVFHEHGIKGGETEKGNESFTEKVLAGQDHALAKVLLDYRDAQKRANTYYSSFLYHADDNGIVHPNLRQSATTTGRFSITDPALQTLEAVDDGLALADSERTKEVRRSFIPRMGFIFVAIDYKNFEFRAMLDTAGERELADEITNGKDVHTTTATLVGITRQQAKTLNFLLLYGGGVAKLAGSLGLPVLQAKQIKQQYFDKLPNVKKFISRAAAVAAEKKFVVSRFGRPYRFTDPKFSYRAPNHLIQGGTASAVKKAMVDIHQFLVDKKSKLILQIHDEVLLEISKDEVDLIPQIKDIMEKAWPEKFHKMECSVEWSDKSWADLDTYGEETRNSIQGKDQEKARLSQKDSGLLRGSRVNKRDTGLVNVR